MKRIRHIVPARFVHDSDFKCACPGADEAEMLASYAAWIALDVQTSFVQRDDDGKTRVSVEHGNAATTLRFEHAKYYFPPVAVLSYLNRELERRGQPERFVALTLDGRELVVLVEPAQLGALRDLGARIVHEGVDTRVFAP